MQRKIKLSVAIAVILILAILVIRAWLAQSGAGTTCSSPIDRQSDNTYIQIELREQDPVEPVFSGILFCYFFENDPKVTTLEVETKGAQKYGNSVDSGKVVRTEGARPQFIVNIKDYSLNPIAGSHRLFPFDSAEFNTELALQPAIPVSNFIVINRVSGFVLDCSTVSASSLSEGKISIRFKLYRNPLVQLCAIVLGIAAMAFAALILRSKSVEGLASAAASSFFSMWSVRSILSSQIHVFPTLLDLIILTANIMLLVTVFWRVLVGVHSGPTLKQQGQS